jgi:hypothetical protein
VSEAATQYAITVAPRAIARINFLCSEFTNCREYQSRPGLKQPDNTYTYEVFYAASVVI